MDLLVRKLFDGVVAKIGKQKIELYLYIPSNITSKFYNDQANMIESALKTCRFNDATFKYIFNVTFRSKEILFSKNLQD